jgi:hypothetical protein
MIVRLTRFSSASRDGIRRMLLLIGLIWILWPAESSAQSVSKLSSEARASMITILPGEDVYTEFGHSALRIADPRTGVNRLYNYGTFDFNEPFFVLKFTYGRLDYMLSTGEYASALSFYKRMGRPVIEQHLNLTAEQTQRLFRFLEINARPENRTYRYDFLFDNCSTRVRDALVRSLGPIIQFTGKPSPGKSFRRLLDPYVADRRLLDVGFDIGLGSPADRIASPREVMFLPEYLFEAFEHARIAAADGPEPLVVRTDTVYWRDNYDAREATFPWPLLATWLLFGLVAAVTVREVRSLARGRDRADAKAPWDAVLFGMTGIVGLLLCFLWFISEHQVTNYNWNLAWAWPTHLVLAVALARGRTAEWLRPYALATAVATGLLSTGWFFWPQGLHEAILPIALILTTRSAFLVHRLTTRSGMRVPKPETTADVETAPTA